MGKGQLDFSYSCCYCCFCCCGSIFLQKSYRNNGKKHVKKEKRKVKVKELNIQILSCKEAKKHCGFFREIEKE